MRAALASLYQVADGGSMRAAFHIMRIYRNAHIDPVALEKAAECEQRMDAVTFPEKPNLVAEQGTKAGQNRLCRNLVADAMSAFDGSRFEEAAKYGHKRAQYLIANMYAEGLGVPRDANEALYWSESSKTGKPLL